MSQVRLDEILMCPSLPSLPAVAVRLLELTSDPDVAISDIAKLVQQDQALAAKVLKTVNSSFYGLSSPCASIDRAMGYLGLNTVKSLVLGFSLVEATDGAAEGGFDLEAHWRRAIIGSTGARVLAKHVGGSDPEDAFTASLFQDMGMLAIFTMLRSEYSSEIADVPHQKLSQLEQDTYSFDHAQVGSELAKRWNLPAEIVEAIRFHHRPEQSPGEYREIASLVSVGARICSCMDPDAPGSAVRSLERVMSELFESRAPDAEALLSEVSETSKTLAKMFEQDIGEVPSGARLMAAAQEQGVEHQLSMQRHADELAREALVDGLTQVANRKRFDLEMKRVYKALVESGEHFGMLFFDADRFKGVNDTFGHAAGDVVLVELARRTSEVVGNDGTVFRYGGEEFAVIIDGRGVDWCAELAEKIRVSIASQPFSLAEIEGAPDELNVSVSIGVSSSDASAPTRLSSAQQVVQEADECVYAAKSDGRNNVKVYGRFSQLSIPSSSSESVPVDLKGMGSTAQTSNGNRFLLIEDDALAATLVITLLKRRGHVDIEWVKSGTRACTMIESGELSGKNTPKLILCDFSLPGCDGHEVLRVTREAGGLKDVPFVMLTGTVDQHMREESLRRGATSFIHKDEFCSDVNRWLGELLGTDSEAA